MVKDRLLEFQKRQNEKRPSNCFLEIDSNENSGDEREKLRKTFQRAEILGHWIEKIEKNNEEIRINLRKFDDMKFYHKDVEKKLQTLFDDNKKIAQEILTKLKEVDKDIMKFKADCAEARIKHIQYTTLKTRYQEAFLQNNQLLENYRNIQKQLIKAQVQAKGYIQVSDEEIENLLDEGGDIHIFTENIIAETLEAKRFLASVEERHQTLLQIERSLIEVRDLFVQMSILVDSQQELIDRIEYQAQSATEYIGVGTGELETAKKSKKKYKKRKFYFIIALIIILIIILILIFK